MSLKVKCIPIYFAATMLVAQNAPLAQEAKQTIITVVKIIGINWFNRMEAGVKEFGQSHPSIKTSQVGPGKADQAQQLRMIEDVIAKRPDAIAVVPLDPAALEFVLKKALSRGIKVVKPECLRVLQSP